MTFQNGNGPKDGATGKAQGDSKSNETRPPSVPEGGNTVALQALTRDILPVVVDPAAAISPRSSLKDVGKAPSVLDADGYVVGFREWTTHVATADEVRAWRTKYGLCIQTRRLRVIDIDIDGLDLAGCITDHVFAHLPERLTTLPRRGRKGTGRCVLAFVVEPGNERLCKRWFTVKDSGGRIVEFLADGQQFVAKGLHVKSETPYTWDESGREIPDEFPVLTRAEFEVVWAALVAEFAEPGSANISKSGGVRNAGIVNKKLVKDDRTLAWLYDSNLVTDSLDGKKVAIECPWAHLHTTEDKPGSSATVYLPAGTGREDSDKGNFKCRHAHCENRTTPEFVDALGCPDPWSRASELTPFAVDDDDDTTTTAGDAVDEIEKKLRGCLPRVLPLVELIGDGAQTAQYILRRAGFVDAPVIDWPDGGEWDDNVKWWIRRQAKAIREGLYHDGTLKPSDDDDKSEWGFRTRAQRVNTKGADFLIPGLLLKPNPGQAHCCLVFGESNQGKSLLSTLIAGSIADGLDWNGVTITQGSVVYMSAEATSEVDTRNAAYRIRYGTAGDDRMIFADDQPDLTTDKRLKTLAAEIHKAFGGENPVLLILDPLNQSLGGTDENNATAISTLFTNVRKLAKMLGGCNVLVVHHVARGTKRGRGSTAIESNCQTRVYCELRKDAPGGAYSRFVVERSKYGATGKKFGIRLERIVLDPANPDVMEDVPVLMPDAEMDARERGVLQARKQHKNPAMRTLTPMFEQGGGRIKREAAIVALAATSPAKGERVRRDGAERKLKDCIMRRWITESAGGWIALPGLRGEIWFDDSDKDEE